MSAESAGSEILDQFRFITNKLNTKRFLRKPNVTEACKSFTRLALQCENAELPAYAGMSWISTARCEGSIGNVSNEANCLLRAGRQFLAAEDEDHRLGCVNPGNENLEAALGCFAYASSRMSETSPFPVGLNLELVDFYKKLEKNGNVEELLLGSINKSGDNLETRVYCMDVLAGYYIEAGNYVSALNTFTQIVEQVDKMALNGARSEVLLKCEVCCIFLLLILKPSPQRLSTSLGKLLESYTWGDCNNKALKGFGMSQEMFIALQSLVVGCQSRDSSNLDYLETVLWGYLGNDERNLLRILVKIHN